MLKVTDSDRVVSRSTGRESALGGKVLWEGEFWAGSDREGVADGESGESSHDNDLLDSLCVRREESVTENSLFGRLHLQYGRVCTEDRSSILFRANLDLLDARREDLCRRFSVILWILPPVFTASFLHPDPPLSPLGSDLLKSFLKYVLVPSAIVLS